MKTQRAGSNLRIEIRIALAGLGRNAQELDGEMKYATISRLKEIRNELHAEWYAKKRVTQ